MPQTSAWHSIKEDVYHNNTSCGPGSQILPSNRQSGTGNKPICKDCKELNSNGK